MDYTVIHFRAGNVSDGRETVDLFRAFSKDDQTGLRIQPKKGSSL